MQAISELYAARGAAVVPFVADNRTSLQRADGYRRAVLSLVDDVARAHANDPRPLVVHAFSNHGFCASVSFLEEIEARHPDLFAKLTGLLFDSAPGIPEAPSLAFTASYVPRSAMPGLLTALRMRPAYRHPVFTPVLSAISGLIHVALPGHVAAFASTPSRMLAMLKRSREPRVLFLWGGADELVPHELVEAFADQCKHAGVHVERKFFPASPHVRHFLGHRTAYVDAVTRLLDGLSEP